jgi:recombination protein RecR
MTTNPIDKLTKFLTGLPGVGQRTSARYVEYMTRQPENELKEIGDIISNLKNHIHRCNICNLTYLSEKCPVCGNQHRETNKVLVVRSSSDVKAIESGRQWKGLYHVLGGLLNPIRNIGPEQLTFKSLENRLKSEKIKELIIGTNFDNEGDLTALNLKKMGEEYKVKVTRLARGLPTGADLEYMDGETLRGAIENRD